MASSRRFPLRGDWMPTNRAEMCACVTVLVLNGAITADDARYVADWIAFRFPAPDPVHQEQATDG